MTFIPAYGANLMDLLEQGTGVRPEAVGLVGPRRWRMRHANGRVVMTLDLKLTRPGKWAYHSSTLTVDGATRPWACCQRHYMTIFKDPEKHGQSFSGLCYEAPAELDPMPPAADLDTAPQEIRDIWAVYSRKLAADDTTCTLGFDGTYYVIRAARDPQHGIQLRLRPHKPGRLIQRLQVVVDGKDFTRAVGRDLDRALLLLRGGNPGEAAPDGAGPARRTAPAQTKPTSVQVRQTTVIRV